MSEIGAAEEAVEKIAAEDPNPWNWHTISNTYSNNSPTLRDFTS
jgi:hypothetical protein